MTAGYPQGQVAVGALGSEARAAFISRTYSHLFAAFIGFTLLEVFLFKSGLAESIYRFVAGVNWLWILGGFVLVSWLASRWAHRAISLSTQYLGLVMLVVAEAIIFVPLLYVANYYAPGVITSAALVTLVAFAGLTAVAFTTRKDFSFLGGLLRWGFILALVAIVAGVIFGFELGTFFSVAMVGLAGAAILYDTSNVIHHFPEDRYVAASMELFASVALMFWYVLRIFLGSRD
jgi:FtsH-binding integral membrane protein